MGSPKKIKDPRGDAASVLSGLIQSGLGQAPAGHTNFGPGQLGSFIQSQFQLPAYPGQVSQGVTPGQTGIASRLLQMFSGDTSQQGLGAMAQPLSILQNFAQSGPSSGQIQSLLGALPGSDTLASISGGQNNFQQLLQGLTAQQPQFFSQAANLLSPQQNPAIAGLLSAGQQNTPERQLLLQAAGGNPLAGAQQGIGQAQSLLGNLASNQGIQNLLNGGGVNLQSIYAPLEAQRQQGLAQDQASIREQFSSQGLRNSSALANAMGRQAAQSQTGLQATLAPLTAQILGQQQQGQLGALSGLSSVAGQLGQLGGQLGTLGLGQQANVLQGLGQAGQLGLGGSQLGISALGQAGQLSATEAARQTGLAGQLAGLGLNQQGQNAGILQALLGSQQGAAGTLGSQGLSVANILSQLQGNALQAGLALPGATSELAQLPYQLGNLAAGQQNINQQVGNQALQQQYQAYLNQQQLFPQLLSFLSGVTPPQLAPSTGQQLFGDVLSAGALGVGAKQLKG